MGDSGRCGTECPIFQSRECDEQDSFDDDFILNLVNELRIKQPLSPFLYEGDEIFSSKFIINKCNEYHEDLLLEMSEVDSTLYNLFFKYYNKNFNLK